MNYHQPTKHLKTTAFTLIEVLVALAVVALGFVALIRLHLISLNMADNANLTTQATLLADEKISQIQAHRFPQLGSTSGTAQKNNTEFHWHTSITNARLPHLHHVNVDVTWKQGSHNKHISLATYIAEGNLP